MQMPPSLPGSYLVLETSNTCSLSCQHCSVSEAGHAHHQQKGWLKLSTAEALFGDLERSGTAFDALILFWLGEPLIHPQIKEIYRRGLRAASRGWSLDHTHDLARVLRLPGTLNHKTNPPRMVSLLKNDGPRYDVRDFDEILDQHKIPCDFQAARRAATGWASMPAFALAPDVSVDDRMLTLLLDASPKFKATWLRARWDLNNGDPSQSHYDLAIANFGLDAGLSEQLIVNLMIQHRRGNPELKTRS